jgi:hypothetical protein
MSSNKNVGNPNLKKGGPSLNPAGRPKGTKNRLTLMQNELIDQFAGEMNKEFKAILRTVIREAKGGDMTAARLLLDRAIPARKAVEHYGAQESGSIIINVQGIDNLGLNKPAINADFEEIDSDERQTVQ